MSDWCYRGSKIVRDLHDGKEEEVAEFVTFGSHFEKIADDILQKWGVFFIKSFFGTFDFPSYQAYNMGGL